MQVPTFSLTYFINYKEKHASWAKADVKYNSFTLILHLGAKNL